MRTIFGETDEKTEGGKERNVGENEGVCQRKRKKGQKEGGSVYIVIECFKNI